MADDDDKDKLIADLRKEEAGLRRKLRDTEARAAQLEASEGDRDKIIAAAKAEGAAEARSQLGAEHAQALAGAELRAVAARTLADPDDAVRFLDLTEVLVDGKVDRPKMDQMLAELVERKPYLAASGGGGGGGGGGDGGNGTGKPTGSGDGGPRPPALGTSDDQFNAALRKAAGRS